MVTTAYYSGVFNLAKQIGEITCMLPKVRFDAFALGREKQNFVGLDLFQIFSVLLEGVTS
jgi:hypothetical protein